MPRTTYRCGLSQLLYASWIATYFVKPSLASFLPVLAGVLVGGALGRVSKKTPRWQYKVRGVDVVEGRTFPLLLCYFI